MSIYRSVLMYLSGLIVTSVAILAAGWSALAKLLENKTENATAITSTTEIMGYMAWCIFSAAFMAGFVHALRCRNNDRHPEGSLAFWAFVVFSGIPLIPGFMAVWAMGHFQT